MSKNFELLQKLGKDREFFQAFEQGEASAAERAPAPTTVAPQPENALLAPELEPINAMVQQVFLSPGADAPRTVVFTSTEAGTGCSWVCAHVAEVLASRVAGSVCVVDANLRDPGLHAQFGVENQPGVADCLQHLDPIRSFARPLSRPNLWLISGGSGASNPAALLSSERVRLRITEMRSNFDFILIDAAAMNLSHDAISLGALADGVMLVLKANASRRQTARQAINDLQAGKAKVLGAVLNQRTFPIPEAIYNKF